MAQLNIAWRGNVEPRTRNDYATSSLRRAKINIRPSFPPFALYIAIKEKKGKKEKKKKKKRKDPTNKLKWCMGPDNNVAGEIIADRGQKYA